MSNQEVIEAAMKVRVDLVGQIESMESDLRQKVINLRSLDATLRMLSPGIVLEDVIPQPFPPQHHAARGEVKTIIINTLKASAEPLTAGYLTEVVMKARGLPLAHKPTRLTIRKRVVKNMSYLREAGIVEPAIQQGQRLFWRLSSPPQAVAAE